MTILKNVLQFSFAASGKEMKAILLTPILVILIHILATTYEILCLTFGYVSKVINLCNDIKRGTKTQQGGGMRDDRQ